MNKEQKTENKNLTANFGNTMLYDVFIAKMIGIDTEYSNDVYKDSKSGLRHIVNNRSKKDGLLFSSDWNWLMYVVEFINKRDWVTIYRDECKIHSLIVGEFKDIIVIDEQSQFNAIYVACGKYAEWYLQNIV